MSPERWEEVERLFLEVRALPPELREAFLAERCADDPALADEVRAMLRGLARDPSFLLPPGEEAEPELPRELGPFRLLAVLGAGSSGTVYRAWERDLEREVALKVLAPHVGSARMRERFRREPRAMAHATHPGIVPVYATGVAEGCPWMAMELVDGHDLARELRRLAGDAEEAGAALLPPYAGPEYVPTVARVGVQVARALQHAHDHGVVHRDLKPHNLLLDRAGRVRIVDFGLARDERFGSVEESVALLGTPHYMSPEQVRAVQAEVDHRTDLYSLGVVLYELLTLARPVDGDTCEEILEGIRRREPRPLRSLAPRVPHELALVVHKAMAKEREDRYASTGELADDLERFLRHEAVRAGPVPLARRLRRLVRRRRWEVALGASVLAVALLTTSLGRQWAAAQQVGARVAELRADFGARRGGLGALPPLELVRLRGLLDEVGAAAAADGVPVDALEAELAALEGERLRRAEERLADARREGVHPAAAVWARMEAADLLRGVALLRPDDARVAERLAEAVPTPRLTLVAPRAGAAGRAWLRPIDLYTGQPGPRVALPGWPLEDFPVEPGLARVVVELTGGRLREYTRGFPAEDAEVRVEISDAGPDSTAGMVRFERAELRLPEEDRPWCHLAGETVVVEPFSIDEHEARNADYERFLAAHPERHRPRHWPAGPLPDAWLDLPVTAVPFADAQAFAEWQGKRLPTHAELELAGRGPEGRRTPWPEGTLPPPRAHLDEPRREPRDWEDAARIYLESARPVRSLPEARTPEGLYHVLGNVHELTESVMVTVDGGALQLRVQDRVRLGGGWSDATRRFHLGLHDYTGTTLEHARYDQGFRCARSATR